MMERTAAFIVKLLKAAKVADLPVEQAGDATAAVFVSLDQAPAKIRKAALIGRPSGSSRWTLGAYFNAVETDWNVVFRLVPVA